MGSPGESLKTTLDVSSLVTPRLIQVPLAFWMSISVLTPACGLVQVKTTVESSGLIQSRPWGGSSAIAGQRLRLALRMIARNRPRRRSSVAIDFRGRGFISPMWAGMPSRGRHRPLLHLVDARLENLTARCLLHFLPRAIDPILLQCILGGAVALVVDSELPR